MIRRAPWVVLTLIVLLVGALLGLLGTRAGNLWLLQRANAALPGELVAQGWRGDLLGGLSVARLEYHQDQLALRIDRLDLALAPWDLLTGWLHVRHLRAERITLALPDGDRGEPSGPFIMPNSVALPIGIQVDELHLTRFTLAGDEPLHVDAIEVLDLAARADLHARHLALSVANTRLAGTLRGDLSTPYGLEGALTWQRPGAPDAVPEALGALGFNGNIQNLAIHHSLAAPLQLISAGSLGYRRGTLHLDIHHRWPAQALPMELPVPLQLGDGELTTRGSLDALVIQGQADLSADHTPVHLALDSEASLSVLQLHTLTVTSGKQRLNLSGRLDYGEGLAWALNANGQALDPALLAPGWPGELALKATSEGHWNGNDWALSVAPLSLTGTLKQAPVSLRGEAHQTAHEALTIKLDAHWAKDRLSAQGTVGDQLKVDGQLSIAQAQRWYAAAQGSLSADWHLHGPLKTPRLSGQARGRNLAFQNWHLARLAARFSDLNAGGAAMRLSLRADQLSQDGNTRLDRATLTANGTRAKHTLTLDAEQEGARTHLRLSAGLSAGNLWKGHLQSWTLSQRRLGQWQVREPVPFALGPTSQSLGRLCLTNERIEGYLCAQGEHHANGGVSGQAEIRELPLALANPWLGDGLRLRGTLHADVRVGGRLPAPNGQWQLTLEDAAATITGTDLQHTLEFSQAKLEGSLQNQRLRNQLDLVVNDQGELHARVNAGLDPASPLEGTVKLSLPDLGAWAPLIPRVGEAHGAVQGELALAGTLAQPQVAGILELTEGQVTVPELGIRVAAIDLALQGGPAGGLTLNGTARFGDGVLDLRGQWSPAQSPLALTLTARGDDLLVANRTDAEVWVSPDLTLTGDDQGLRLTGTLAVPKANLAPRELPESAITVSDDQVLVDARAKPAPTLAFAMAVGVTLGEEVHFRGFGLDATLGGQLRISQQPGKPVQLNGELLIQEGRYRAYGQNLAIENGRLLFQGPPDNPGLDIRAIRKIPSENLVVGVQLSGTLQQPRAHIFSEPSLEESEAMSYLLTGRSLSRGTQGDSAKVAQALALYGLQKGSGVTQKIGDKLGLDEVTIGSDWETADAALMLGKQISERLYLTYAVGLFDAISTVMLRYTLTRQLHLEAQSSTKSQAIDLIWEKELK